MKAQLNSFFIFGWLSFLISTVSCTSVAEHKNKIINASNYLSVENMKLDTATFATGCFWCTEAIFQRLKGVELVKSGYSGGELINPSYEEVCTGTTGHAECCQILFNPVVISYDELLEVFWKTHDPTTLNRQGNDVGTQYRSAIFYHNGEQKGKAEKYKVLLSESGAFNSPIVTSIEPYKNFYMAEMDHQNYYNSNPEQMYCRYVIVPKLEKFEKVFHDKLKNSTIR